MIYGPDDKPIPRLLTLRLGFNRSTLSIEIRVKQPETIQTVSNAVLTA